MQRPAHRSTGINWFLFGGLALTFIIALGCGSADEEPTAPTECVAGETQPAADGCNTCTCTEDGSWACTELACHTPSCAPGDTSFDGCNNCTCNEDGLWLCTKRYCPPEEADLGEACSMNGTQCVEGLECEYQCPDPSADPTNCNLGINPSGVCVPADVECIQDADCIVAGCSGQICQPSSEPPLATTCEWREEYACYGAPTSTCQCNDGVCGWSPTQALQQCLNNAAN